MHADLLHEFKKPGNFIGALLTAIGILLAMPVYGGLFRSRCDEWTLNTLMVAMISGTWGLAASTIQEYHFVANTDRTTRFVCTLGMLITACIISKNMVHRRYAEHGCVLLYGGLDELRQVFFICLMSAACVRITALAEPIARLIARWKIDRQQHAQRQRRVPGQA